MLTMIKNWAGSVEINGVSYDSMDAAIKAFKPVSGAVSIRLIPHTKKAENEASKAAVQPVEKTGEVRITVKQYMTKKATPEFDFMAKWNNDVPMPYRTMTGKVIKETRGMVYMQLHGDIWAERITTCMCCGRVLTNPVSQFFGVGPECGGHGYTHPFNSDAELKAAVADMKQTLRKVTWEGWVIRSAIVEQVEV